MRRAWRVALCLGLGSLALAGCGGGRVRRSERAHPSAALTAPLRLYGPLPATKAFVELTLEGHPYYFIVDSGAAATIIDSRIARKLALRDDGAPREFAPLGCRVYAQPVALRSWRLGDTSLPASTVFTQRLLLPRAFANIPFAGLLGSDFLSRYGTVTIDFRRRTLILGANSPTGVEATAIRVLRRGPVVLATTQVGVDNHPRRFVIDTGSPISLIDATPAAQLRLPVTGPPENAIGAVCRSSVTPVLIHDWTFASVRFPQAVIGRAPDFVPPEYVRQGVVGIIGTASLARRGTLTIDYAHSRMILGGTVR